MGTGGQVGTGRKPQRLWPLKGELAESAVEAAAFGGHVVTSDQHSLLK